MKYIRTSVALVGFFLVALVDVLPDFIYVSMRHPVGEDAVQVFESSLIADDIHVPVMRSDIDGRIIETGSYVKVLLRSDYRDGHLLAKPTLILLIVSAFSVLYILASVLHLRK